MTHDLSASALTNGRGTSPLLDEVEQLLAELFPGRNGAAAEVRARANEVWTAGGGSAEAARFGALELAADVLVGAATSETVAQEAARALVSRVAGGVGLSPELAAIELHARAVRNPRLTELGIRDAVDAHLSLLVLVLGTSWSSLWLDSEGGRIECVAHCGDLSAIGDRARRAAAQADEIVAGEPGVVVVPIVRHAVRRGALVVEAPSPLDDALLGLARESARALGLLLEREALLANNAAKERMLVQASERRLIRMGFDLHDGPLQDVAALASDVRFFRKQLEEVVENDDRAALVLGRVDDLSARLIELDRELRTQARSLEAPPVARRRLAEVLAEEVELFKTRTEIVTTLSLDGEFTCLSASQRITLLRIVQEALANVREHSGATEVRVEVAERAGYVHAQIEDNGGGFDVERTFIHAMEKGRLGLLGMSERVRLLGGMFDVSSRPGGPTQILVTLPEWNPLQKEESGGSGGEETSLSAPEKGAVTQ